MTPNLKHFYNSHTLGLLAQFGQHHHANFIHSSDKMMEDHPVRSKDHLDGLPSLTPQQLLQVQESKEIHRRSSILCIAVFQQGGFAGKEQPINSLAWRETFHQQFLSQCPCYLVATPACQWGLDWYKTWAIAATSDRNQIFGSPMQSHHSPRLPRQTTTRWNLY